MAAAPVVNPGSAVRVRGVVKRYGRRPALDGIDLDAAPGRITGVVGADGAGKSTLLRILAGVLAPDAGEIEVLGMRVRRTRDAERLKPRLGLLSQGLGQNLVPSLTVLESLEFFARLAGVPRADARRRQDALLETTRLVEAVDRRVADLSGGMRQKLGLACVLLHEPDLLLLDEPTAGLDPLSRRQFWEFLGGLVAERGLSAVVATADLTEVADLDIAHLIQRGRVIARGDLAELIDLSPGVVATWPVGTDLASIEALCSAWNVPRRLVDVRGGRLRAFLPGASEARLRADPRAGDVDCTAPELEDVLVARFGDESNETVGPATAPPPRDARAPRRETAIAAAGLARRFGSFVAADSIDLEVAEGSILGLLGANGAGKTTVVKMLVGLLAPSAGTVRIAGLDVLRETSEVRRRIGYVSQLFSLYPDLTVLENLRLAAGIYGVPRRDRRRRIDWAIALAGLEELRGTLPPSLPVGHRQRLAIACAILHRPAVLFLDEPTSGVDAAGRRRFWRIVQTLARETATAVLLTTHAMGDAGRCDELALMHRGRIVARGTPGELVATFARSAGRIVTIPTPHAREALEVLRRHGARDAIARGATVRTPASDPDEAALRLATALAASGIAHGPATIADPDMDDVFVGRLRELDAAAPDRPS